MFLEVLEISLPGAHIVLSEEKKEKLHGTFFFKQQVVALISFKFDMCVGAYLLFKEVFPECCFGLL